MSIEVGSDDEHRVTVIGKTHRIDPFVYVDNRKQLIIWLLSVSFVRPLSP